MSFGFELEVWGPYALFSRPELKTERYSYEMITPSAARGIIESIYWHPGLRVVIDRIYLLPGKEGITDEADPFHYENIRRNEVKAKAQAAQFEAMLNGGKEACLVTSKEIQQRASAVLRDVHYVVKAHFEMTGNAKPSDNEGKFADTFRRRIGKGRFFSEPYFGCREFPVHFAPWPSGEDIIPMDVCKDLGIMLYDLDYTDKEHIKPMYFHAKLEHGVMQVAGERVMR
ncbi:MAG: type I-C CRISPR-associated protein Cas5 [Blautia sp.]|nr:type I-C CRISPR-associated protein Cas5 [Blautia sp.]MBR2527837.1 type I-C CRISPR-associated protein Cas5 [Blautia sp.]